MKKLLLLFVVVILCVSSVSAANQCPSSLYSSSDFSPYTNPCPQGYPSFSEGEVVAGMYCAKAVGTPADGYEITGAEGACSNHTWYGSLEIDEGSYRQAETRCNSSHWRVNSTSGGGGGGSVRKL